MTQSKNKEPEIKIFGTVKQEEINFITPPYAVRNDCRIGQWKVGENKLIGDSLAISIIGVRNFYGKLGKARPCDWKQLWFIAAQT